MVFVEEDSVVMHTPSITSSSGMLSVFSDTPVAGADMASLLPVLLEPGCHGGFLLGLFEIAAEEVVEMGR